MNVGLRYVTVGVRIRPKLENPANFFQMTERYEPVACFCFSDTTICVSDDRVTGDSRKFFFAYDAVFDESSTQEEIFDELASAAVADVLKGTSATILAYGQTGSGKTHTVLGEVAQCFLNDKIITRDTGILLRALQEMLHYKNVNKDKVNIVIVFSAVEVYLDKVRDLLSDEKTPAIVQMTFAKNVVHLSGLTYVSICSLGDGLRAFQKANDRRVQRMTSANDVSSRSHAIFTIELFQQPIASKNDSTLDLLACTSMRDAMQLARMEGRATKPLLHQFFCGASHQLLGTEDAPVLYSKLSIVDLAGSEKVCCSFSNGEGFDEFRKINSSLGALGKVINNLYEGSGHVPYRDSKLTTLLCDSFTAPNSRVVLIVNVSPTILTVDETLSSLHFADKVKMLKPTLCRGDRNGKNTVSDYYSTLREFDELIADVRLAGLLYNFSVPQVVLFLVNELNNVIYDMSFHVRKPDSEISKMAFTIMCGALKNTAEKASLNAIQKQNSEMESVKDVFCNKFLVKWRKRRINVILSIDNICSEIAKKGFAEAPNQENNDCIDEALVLYKEARDTRRDIQKKYNIAAARIADAEHLMRSIDKDIQYAESAEEDADVLALNMKKEHEVETFRQQDDLWAWGLEQVIRALALANMRFDLCSLMRDNQRLIALLKRHGEKIEIVKTERSSIYDWLRSAVWAIAGNAVVISVRRKKRRYLNKSTVSSEFRGSNRNIGLQMSQFWRLQQTGSSCANEKKRKLLSSRYDDAALLDNIMSFMKMGGKIMMCSRNGLLRQWLLYVEGRTGHEKLCWTSPRSMGSRDYISLRAVTRILLGRGHAHSGQGSARLGWAVVLNKQHSTKVIDFVCDTVSELEMWVIGIGKITGKKPVFEEPMKMPPETLTVWDSLNVSDVAFCAEWHIPPAVYTEARRQLLSRLSTHSSRAHRLSPGVLRNLVKLDIFRASAMWLRFRAEGLVEQPGEKLYCYVDILPVPQKEVPSFVMAGSSAGRLIEQFSCKVNKEKKDEERKKYIERRVVA